MLSSGRQVRDYKTLMVHHTHIREEAARRHVLHGYVWIIWKDTKGSLSSVCDRTLINAQWLMWLGWPHDTDRPVLLQLGATRLLFWRWMPLFSITDIPKIVGFCVFRGITGHNAEMIIVTSGPIKTQSVCHPQELWLQPTGCKTICMILSLRIYNWCLSMSFPITWVENPH